MNNGSTGSKKGALFVALGASLLALASGCAPGILTDQSPSARSDARTSSKGDGLFNFSHDVQLTGEGSLAMDSEIPDLVDHADDALQTDAGATAP